MFTLRWKQRDDTFKLEGKIGAVLAARKAFLDVPSDAWQECRWEQPHDIVLLDEDGDELDPDTLATKEPT